MTPAPQFGWMMGAVGADGESDAALYRQMIADAELGAELGYDAAWVVEHHFSDYYPTPSPLLLIAHIAARFPDLSLGTSVLVLPWYHPLRLAEEIAMLNSLTRGTLHLGIGRGTAKMDTPSPPPVRAETSNVVAAPPPRTTAFAPEIDHPLPALRAVVAMRSRSSNITIAHGPRQSPRRTGASISWEARFAAISPT